MEGGSRFRQRLAVLLAFLAIAEALAIAVLGAGGDYRFSLGLNSITIGFVGVVVLFPLVGALIALRRPRTKVAWLMIAIGLAIGFGLVTYAYGVVGQPPGKPALPFVIPALVLSQLFFVPAIAGLTTGILLLYPTDELLSPRWRFVGLLAFVAATAYVVGTLFRPGEFDSEMLPGVTNPLGATGSLGVLAGGLADGGNILGIVPLALAAISLVLRYRRASLVVAAQIRWLALAAILAIVTLAISLAPLPGTLDDDLFGIGLILTACMPIAIGIAITRYRLYEIDRLINRTLVYGALTAILAGVFTAGVGLAQRLFIAATHETSDAAVVGATLVVATLYAPLRKRLEAIVDRRFKFEQATFGAYREELSRILSAIDPNRAAGRLVGEAVRELPAVGGAVLAADGSVAATAGLWPVEPLVRMTIPGGGGPMRLLAIGPRPDGELHDPRNLAALEDVAALAAAAATRDAAQREAAKREAATAPRRPEG
jgi:hypothetical protein